MGLNDGLVESRHTDAAPSVGVVAVWFQGYGVVVQRLRQRFYLRTTAKEYFEHVVFRANALHAWSDGSVVLVALG